MSIEVIAATGAVAGKALSAAGALPSRPAPEASFETWLVQQFSATNAKLVEADQGVRRLALGEADNLHQVMIALEEAKLQFELVVQVRNRLVEAYQDILRMRI
ncbi:MAG TPA: flagellar hook-basal body complex protein FliE [Gammaproteobacteria bacterium]|nr:flagellar hook-basal body complex protein FliE [Gammaproteobacteria bacterium]